jgi:hypothetical protein
MRKRTARHTAAHSETPHPAGKAVTGDFICHACSYGVSIYHSLPTCPMCGGSEWVVRTARSIIERRAPNAAK